MVMSPAPASPLKRRLLRSPAICSYTWLRRELPQPLFPNIFPTLKWQLSPSSGSEQSSGRSSLFCLSCPHLAHLQLWWGLPLGTGKYPEPEHFAPPPPQCTKPAASLPHYCNHHWSPSFHSQPLCLLHIAFHTEILSHHPSAQNPARPLTRRENKSFSNNLHGKT